MIFSIDGKLLSVWYRARKFRAKSADTGEYVFALLDEDEEDRHLWRDKHGNSHIVEPKTIRQFIGTYKDRDIYESDTVVIDGYRYRAELTKYGCLKCLGRADTLFDGE